MTNLAIIAMLQYAELVAIVVTFAVMIWRKQVAQFYLLAAFLGVRAAADTAQSLIWFVATNTHISKVLAYQIYFYAYWGSYAVEALLAIGIVYNVYKLAMAPLKGLQTLGMLMFRWAAAIAVAVAIGNSVGPHLTAGRFLMTAVIQLQKTQSILTLCLLVFVTFAIRPMGLSYRSKIFGVSMGLGMLSATDLISTAWIMQGRTMVSAFSVFNGIAVLVTLATWTIYFVMPEPRRRIIVLPTTSPFLRWNQISEALGDDPGYVAMGGVHPDLFAPAELEVMQRASVKMLLEPISAGK